jgi:hypothetical protein
VIQKARVFVLNKFFEVGLMPASKVRSLPLDWVTDAWSTKVGSSNKTDLKKCRTNVLAFCRRVSEKEKQF